MTQVAAPSGSAALGYACGAIMALGSAIAFAAARAGMLGGLAPDDVILARFVVAGLFLLPFLVYWGLADLAGIGWRRGLAHPAGLPRGALAVQGAVQGLLQGVVSIVTYNRAIAILGVSRAVLFPAIVPAISILIGIPLIGETPNLTQVAGLALVSVGMLVAVGLLRRLLPQAAGANPRAQESPAA